MRSRYALVFAVITGFLLAGCAQTSGGQAKPTTTGESSAAQGGAAPKVATPIDPANLLAKPCDALSDSQRAQFGLDAGAPEDAGDGVPRCVWKYPRYQFNNVSVEGDKGHPNGLNDIYALKAQSAYFEETQVAGHPGVYRSDDDQRAEGSCALWIGLTDQAVMLVQGYFSGGSPQVSQSCQEVGKIAEAVVTTLKD